MNEQWRSLIRRYDDGDLAPEELAKLEQALREEPAVRELFLRELNVISALEELASKDSGQPAQPATETTRKPKDQESGSRLLRSLLALAVGVIVAMAAGLYREKGQSERRIAEITEAMSQPAGEVTIARITGLNGGLIWTGDRGQIARDVSIGTELSGGTIEGMAPDSWFELTFNDGSTVTISGTSMLTFADAGQKELRLKEGRFSASVVPQPAGSPMLIRTRSALLKVLGTQFEVEVGPTSTVLNVTEGRVRVTRLIDGMEVDVHAKHRLVAEDDGELKPEPVPDSVDDWKSQLTLGPHDVYGNYGKWIPSAGGRPAFIRAIPFVPPHDRKQLLHLLGLPVVRPDNSPVVVRRGSRFVMRGSLESAADVVLGMRVMRANGEFAGMFLALQPAAEFRSGSEFEVTFPISSFSLDPCVWDRKDELPASPENLILMGVWSFTMTGKPTGLEVTEIELVPPDREE